MLPLRETEDIAENVRMLEGQLSVPAANADGAVIDQAIAMEQGEVVYEILNRQTLEGVLTIKYRALSRQEWTKIAKTPRRYWPLMPAAEQMRTAARRNTMLEILLLTLVAIALGLGMAWQAFEINQYGKYVDRLRGMMPAGVTQMVQGPQERWAGQMNAMAAELAGVGASINAFELTPKGGQISLTGGRPAQVQAVMQKLLGTKALQVKEGLWVWQE